MLTPNRMTRQTDSIVGGLFWDLRNPQKALATGNLMFYFCSRTRVQVILEK